MKYTCKDSIMKLIEDKSKVFGSKYKVSDKTLAKLNEICDGVDQLISAVDCVGVSFEVDESTKRLQIIVMTDELIIYDKGNQFYDLIAKLESFSFSKQSDDVMDIKLNVSDIWECVDD